MDPIPFQIASAILAILVSSLSIYKFRKNFRKFILKLLDAEDGNNSMHISVLSRVKKSGLLHVGCIMANPWFIQRDSESICGIYPLIFDDIARRNNLRVVYTPIRNDVVFSKLNKGEVDLVAQLLLTNERATNATFAAFIHNVIIVAVVRKEQSKIKSISDLRNEDIKCAVVKGEIGEHIAPEFFNMTEDNNRLITLKTADVPSVFYLVVGGVDVAITTAARWIELQERDPSIASQLTTLDKPLNKVPAGCLIKKNESEFKNWLDDQVAISREKERISSEEINFLGRFSTAVEKF